MFVPDWRACWEVMECERGEDCPARKYPGVRCWELAAELSRHPCVPNICSDCIVYLLLKEKACFSEEELQVLARRKVLCTCFLPRL